MTTLPFTARFIPLSASERNRLAEHAEELRLCGRTVVAEILERIVSDYDRESMNGKLP